MIDPEMLKGMEERIARLERDAPALHLELEVRAAAAGRRLDIDPDFAYTVLLLLTVMGKMHPFTDRATLLNLAVMNTLMVELAQEQLDGKIGS